MKSILQSIKPKWCALILNGKKTIEVRTTAPKDWLDYLSGKTKVKPEPSTVYIYCTKVKHQCLYKYSKWVCISIVPYFPESGNGKVIAKYTLREVEEFIQGLNEAEYEHLPNFALKDYDYYGLEDLMEKACLSDEEITKYAPDLSFYAWHISDLEIFDKPKELGEFGLTKAPQSWAYIRGINHVC